MSPGPDPPPVGLDPSGLGPSPISARHGKLGTHAPFSHRPPSRRELRQRRTAPNLAYRGSGVRPGPGVGTLRLLRTPRDRSRVGSLNILASFPSPLRRRAEGGRDPREPAGYTPSPSPGAAPRSPPRIRPKRLNSGRTDTKTPSLNSLDVSEFRECTGSRALSTSARTPGPPSFLTLRAGGTSRPRPDPARHPWRGRILLRHLPSWTGAGGTESRRRGEDPVGAPPESYRFGPWSAGRSRGDGPTLDPWEIARGEGFRLSQAARVPPSEVPP